MEYSMEVWENLILGQEALSTELFLSCLVFVRSLNIGQRLPGFFGLTPVCTRVNLKTLDVRRLMFAFFQGDNMKEKIVVSVIGAGGKMGTRVTNNLAKHADTVTLHFCETSEAGMASIRARGLRR